MSAKNALPHKQSALKLGWRILLSLLLMIGILIGGFVLLADAEADEHLINMAGRQRMLAWRALAEEDFLDLLRAKEDTVGAMQAEKQLRRTVRTLQNNLMYQGPDGSGLGSLWQQPALRQVAEKENLLPRYEALTAHLLRHAQATDPSMQDLGDLTQEVASLVDSQDRWVDVLSTEIYKRRTRQFWIGLPALTLLALLVPCVLVVLPIQRELLHERKRLKVRVKERTAEVEAARMRAEQADKAKSRFLATMSHEFRTPLNCIMGHLQLLLEAPDTEPHQREKQLHSMFTSGDHLLEMINDMLDLAKMESGRMQLDCAPCHLEELADFVRSMFMRPARQAGLDFTVEMKEDHWVLADKRKLRQILLNLVGNAIKYTEAGHVSVCLSWEAEANAQCGVLVAEVNDSGSGIPEDQLSSLFDPYARAVKSEQDAPVGTGLGLAVTRRFAQLMDGEVTVASELGSGSTFVLRVPLELTDPVVEEEAAGDDAAETTIPPRRVLVVDDVAANRLVLKVFLEREGHHVTEAGDAAAALEVLTAQEVDLVLLDQVMPGMSGLQLLLQLRQNPALASLPVVMLTANAYAEDKLKALDAGANDFLSKPVNFSDLRRVLRKVSGKGRFGSDVKA